MAKKKTEETKPATAAKRSTASKAKAPTLDAAKIYKFKANGACPHLPKGKIFEVNGAYAAHYLKMKYGEILD